MKIIDTVHCWKCGSTNTRLEKMRVGRERTSRIDLQEGCEDLNTYHTYHVCCSCDYRFSPYQNRYLKKIVYNQERNQKITDLALRFIKARQSVLIFVQLIEHGNLITIALKEKLQAAGLNPELCSFVNGALDDESNEDVKVKFGNKTILGVTSTNIWSEGTDIPTLRWVIYAKAGKPGIELEQVLGRALRRSPGKWRAGFVDFLDEFDTAFAVRARARQRFLELKGFAPKTLQQVPSSRKISRFLVEKKKA